MEFQQTVLAYIRKNNFVKPGDKVIVGISGGADSLALAHVLAYLRPTLGIQLHLAHYNHKARRSADADQRLVERFAERFELPLTVGLRSLKGTVKHLSEDQARRLRFAFFARMLKKETAHALALAHTENDLAETVLMRLIRGAGLLGLRGILADSTVAQMRIVRPLIAINRAGIEHYLRRHRLKFAVDETNKQPIYLRNKIRLKLLPLLVKEYNPNVGGILLDLANTAQEDFDFLQTQAQKCFKEGVVKQGRMVKIALPRMMQMHPAMRRLVLRMMVESVTAQASRVTFNQVMELEDLLLARPTGSSVHLLKNIKATKLKSYLEIS